MILKKVIAGMAVAVVVVVGITVPIAFDFSSEETAQTTEVTCGDTIVRN